MYRENYINWYGSVENGWVNKETEQVIVFKETGEQVDIWLYNSTDRNRGQRMSNCEGIEEAIVEAREIAGRYDREPWKLI